VNIDPAEASKNYAPTLTLVGDCRTVVRALLEVTPQASDTSGVPSRLTALRQAVEHAVMADEPQAYGFLQAMENSLPEDAVVVTDMCIPGYWLGGFRRVPAPRKLAYPVGWGTLGFGFPASIGSAFADTGPTVCVTGDGGFLVACGELATVVQENVPLTIILIDDDGYGMLRFDQAHAGDARFGVDLVGPDFVALARSFGLSATSVEGFGPAFGSALRQAVRSGKANMLVVRARLRPPPNTSPRWYRRYPAPLPGA
jgi:acetolactate synthase-1/2/3 large subunit